VVAVHGRSLPSGCLPPLRTAPHAPVADSR
jgi:hypothetical protein